jgi:hypothetical protein
MRRSIPDLSRPDSASLKGSLSRSIGSGQVRWANAWANDPAGTDRRSTQSTCRFGVQTVRGRKPSPTRPTPRPAASVDLGRRDGHGTASTTRSPSRLPPYRRAGRREAQRLVHSLARFADSDALIQESPHSPSSISFRSDHLMGTRLPTHTCRALTRGLNGAAPWHTRVRVLPVAGGCSIQMNSLRWGQFERVRLAGMYEPDELVCSVLQIVQHFIAKHSLTAWPLASPLPFATLDSSAHTDREGHHAGPRYLATLPRPGSRVEHGFVRAWYGQESNPALELSPLPLS